MHRQLTTVSDVEAIKWAMKTLKQTEIHAEIVAQTPWSTVLKIHTGSQWVYLKKMPQRIALEADIIQLLQDTFDASVPAVIAINRELSCFLMKDAGISLRCILKKQFDTALVCKTIDQFTSLQIRVSDHIDVLLDIGVPDWRLHKLPDLYREAILQKDLLMDDGLSEREMSALEALTSKVTYLCQQLSDCGIKQTFVQPDFNDNNTLIDDTSQRITLIDLGEIAISHPFFSLVNGLHVLKKHHGLTHQEDMYLTIKEACLKNYRKVESEQNVAKAFEIAHVLWFVYDLVAQDRLIQACGKETLLAFRPGKLREILKAFITVCDNY